MLSAPLPHLNEVEDVLQVILDVLFYDGNNHTQLLEEKLKTKTLVYNNWEISSQKQYSG